MRLEPGTRLGPYEVLSALGAGGMGEVYKARDTRLGREVAVKVLSDEIAQDARALARFQTEAKAVAALSHPNIMALHDVGEASGVHYAVMELLDGETLRTVLGRGPLPVRRALEIASLLAEALAAAHETGIVHRDVKPENVVISKGGHPKLLDFGLARQNALPSNPGFTNSPTADPLTGRGAIVGTIAYMSPEQAQGLPVDYRSDQFSLGTLLYEMLAGKRPFQGASAAEMLTAIIREEPEPLPATAPQIPAPVRWLVDRLLAKDPHGRYDSTRDLARDLRTWSLHLSEPGMASGAAWSAGQGRRTWRSVPVSSVAALVTACVLAGALVTGAVLKWGTARPQSLVTRTEIRLPEGHFLNDPYSRSFALSPDGKLLVYSAFTWKKPFEEDNASQLFLRPLDSFEARPIPGTEGGSQPVFSPDGQHVAFVAGSENGTFLKRVPVAGGPAATISRCDLPVGIAWSPEGSILVGSIEGPLKKVPETGGTLEPATSLDAAENEVSHRLPHLLPDGRTVVYTAERWGVGTAWTKARIFAQRLGAKERSLLAEDGSDGRWVAPGNLLFAREGRLLAAPFDDRRLRLVGKPVPILEGVRHSIWTAVMHLESGTAMLDVSGSGLLAWIPGSVTPQRPGSLAWFDESGKETPVDLAKGMQCSVRVSPGGEQLLVSYAYPEKQLEVLDLSRGGRRNVTFEMEPGWAIWGPGPDRITFTSTHEGRERIYSRKIDAGPEVVETLWKGGGTLVALGSWSRDGQTLAFVVREEKNGTDIWLLEKGKEARPFVATRFFERHPDISADGRWLLYTSDEPGRPEVFVKALTGEGPARQVSIAGGWEPLWSRDGSTIFYWAFSETGGRMTLFRVRASIAGEGLSLGRPEKLFETEKEPMAPGHGWDVGPDGRFLVAKPPAKAEGRAWLEKILSDRIYVDVGGLPGLLARTGKTP